MYVHPYVAFCFLLPAALPPAVCSSRRWMGRMIFIQYCTARTLTFNSFSVKRGGEINTPNSHRSRKQRFNVHLFFSLVPFSFFPFSFFLFSFFPTLSLPLSFVSARKSKIIKQDRTAGDRVGHRARSREVGQRRRMVFLHEHKSRSSFTSGSLRHKL